MSLRTDDGRGDGSGNPFDVLEAYLRKEDWKFERVDVDDGAEMLLFDVSGENGQYKCFVTSNEDLTDLRQYSVASNRIPKDKVREACEFAARYNFRIEPRGHLDIDVRDGEIRVVTYIHFRDSTVSEDMIEELFRTNLMMADHSLEGLLRLIYGDLSAKDACAHVFERRKDGNDGNDADC